MHSLESTNSVRPLPLVLPGARCAAMVTLGLVAIRRLALQFADNLLAIVVTAVLGGKVPDLSALPLAGPVCRPNFFPELVVRNKSFVVSRAKEFNPRMQMIHAVPHGRHVEFSVSYHGVTSAARHGSAEQRAEPADHEVALRLLGTQRRRRSLVAE